MAPPSGWSGRVRDGRHPTRPRKPCPERAHGGPKQPPAGEQRCQLPAARRSPAQPPLDPPPDRTQRRHDGILDATDLPGQRRADLDRQCPQPRGQQPRPAGKPPPPVPHGRVRHPSPAATGRSPTPAAARSNAAPITSTASTRRASANDGSSACDTRHHPQRARRTQTRHARPTHAHPARIPRPQRHRPAAARTVGPRDLDLAASGRVLLDAQQAGPYDGHGDPHRLGPSRERQLTTGGSFACSRNRTPDPARRRESIPNHRCRTVAPRHHAVMPSTPRVLSRVSLATGAFTDRSLPLQARDVAGALPSDRVVLSQALKRYYDPSATLPARCDFPLERLYAPAAPGPQAPGAGEGFPSSRTHPLTIPLPLPRRVPQRLHLQVLGAFHGLRRDSSGSAPSCPFRAKSL